MLNNLQQSKKVLSALVVVKKIHSYEDLDQILVTANFNQNYFLKNPVPF